jgi:hypothetical protein
MKRTLITAAGAMMVLLCITQAFPNVPPPATHLDTIIDGTWKSSTGRTYVISGSGNSRRFMIQAEGADSASYTAFIDYEGNSFRFTSDRDYQCTIVDENTLRVSDGKKTSTWKRVGSIQQKNNKQEK